ncbi:MAG: DUF3526 domain-containing protein [Polyangiales bacterium]
MSAFIALARLELLQLVRSRTLMLGLALFVVCAAVAAVSGTTSIRGDRAVLADRERFLSLQEQSLRKSHPDEDLGIVVYNLALPTEHAPNPWTALATGLRDVFPFSQHMRVLSLVPQQYASELGNPLKQLTGSFDYAFVVTFLLPLLVIALGYDARSRDEELGTELLLRSQPARVSSVLAMRLGLRALVVLATAVVSFVLAAVIAGVPLDARAATWLAIMTVYVLFWTAVVALVAARGRSSGWSAIAAVGAWIVLCILAPATANAVLADDPTQTGIALTIKQREVLNAGWDKPKRDTMEPFAARHSEWRKLEVPEDRFSWQWYYANQELSDAAVEPEVQAYRAAMESREAQTHHLATLLPPLATQRALSHLAGSDLSTRLDYQDSITTYHQALKSFLHPFIFDNQPVSQVPFASIPRHQFKPEAKQPHWSELTGLTLITLGCLLLALLTTRRLDRPARTNA